MTEKLVEQAAMLLIICGCLGFFLVLDVLYYCCYGNGGWVFVTGGFEQKIHRILYIIKALKSGLFKRLANNKSLQCCKVGKCSCVRFFPDSQGMAAIFPNIPRASPLLSSSPTRIPTYQPLEVQPVSAGAHQLSAGAPVTRGARR